jgi:hypothetical protein
MLADRSAVQRECRMAKRMAVPKAVRDKLPAEAICDGVGAAVGIAGMTFRLPG